MATGLILNIKIPLFCYWKHGFEEVDTSCRCQQSTLNRNTIKKNGQRAILVFNVLAKRLKPLRSPSGSAGGAVRLDILSAVKYTFQGVAARGTGNERERGSWGMPC